jgi:hypothetical protein
MMMGGVMTMMTISAAFFGLVAGIVEAVYDGPTLRRNAVAEIELRDQRIAAQADELAEMRTDLDARNRQIAGLADEVATLQRTTTTQADELARLDSERYVTFNGERRLLREVVTETAADVADRATITAARNIASMPGESIPLLGIAVVVAATGLELNDACETSKAMHQLDVAMNPDHAIPDGQTEVCGMTPYTAEEIWEMILNSPAVIWNNMVETYDGLPSLAEAWDWVVNMLKATPGQIWELFKWVWSLLPTIDWPDWEWSDPDWTSWDINPFSESAP